MKREVLKFIIIFFVASILLMPITVLSRNNLKSSDDVDITIEGGILQSHYTIYNNLTESITVKVNETYRGILGSVNSFNTYEIASNGELDGYATTRVILGSVAIAIHIEWSEGSKTIVKSGSVFFGLVFLYNTG